MIARLLLTALLVFSLGATQVLLVFLEMLLKFIYEFAGRLPKSGSS